MLGLQHGLVMLLTIVVITIGMTSATADEVYDEYTATFESPSAVNCSWTGRIEVLTVDSAERTWSNITDNNLENDAAAIAFDSANNTVSGFWQFSSVASGSVSRTGNVVSCTFTVTLDKRSYSLDGYDILSLDDVIDATLEMGGNASIWTTITAEGGHEANVTFDVDDLGDSTGGSGAYVLRPLSWRNLIVVDGLGGPSQDSAYLDIQGRGGVMNEDPSVNATVDMPTTKLYDFNASIDHATFDPVEYDITFPLTLYVPILNAGGIRIFVENGIVDWSDIADDIADELVYGGVDLEGAIQDTFESNGTVDVSLDQSSLDPVPYVRGTLADQDPIVALLQSSSDVGLFDEDHETLMGFFNSGGRARIETVMDLTGYRYEFRFGSPAGLRATPVHGERVGNDARWAGTGLLNTSLWLNSTTAPSVFDNDTNVLIDIDMSDVALLAQKMNYELNAKGRIRWMLLGSELEGGVPRNMEIEYVCADLIRLMYGEGLIDEEDIQNITGDMRDGLEEDSPFSADLDVEFTGYDGAYDFNDMDGRPAVEFTIHSEGEMSLKGGENVLLNMISIPLEFELASVEGWNTTYSILLPEGLSVSKMEVSDGKITKTSDGFKHRVTVRIPKESESIDVKLTLNVGMVFLINQFCVCFQVLLLIVILLSLVKVWKHVKERRAEKADDEMIRKGLKAQTAVATLREARDAERRGETPSDREPPPDREPRDRDDHRRREDERPGRDEYRRRDGGPPEYDDRRDDRPPEYDDRRRERRPPEREERPPMEEPPPEHARGEPEPLPPEEPEPEGPSPVMGRPGPQSPDPDAIGASEDSAPTEDPGGTGGDEVVDEAPVRGRPPRRPGSNDETSELN